MMDQKAILAVYDKVAAVMGLMLEAAEAGDWDALTDLQPQYAAYVDVLRQSDSHEGLSEEELEYKMGVIQTILDSDQRIRELTNPRIQELSDLIGHSVKARKVSRAYGSNMPG